MPGHVLLVEDSKLVTSAFRVLLEESGYEVSIAESVKEAFECASTRKFDLMLLDLILPDGNGIDALNEMRARGIVPAVTLAMTGDDQPSTRVRCIDAGCAAVLVKPVSIRELRRTIAAHLG